MAPVASVTVPVISALLVERAAIMFDLEIERAAALAGLVDDAAGALFEVDDEIVTAVELAIRACAADEVEAIPALIPACRLDAEVACSRHRAGASRCRA